MTVRELLEANFSKTEIDGFKKTYEETTDYFNLTYFKC